MLRSTLTVKRKTPHADPGAGPDQPADAPVADDLGLGDTDNTVVDEDDSPSFFVPLPAKAHAPTDTPPQPRMVAASLHKQTPEETAAFVAKCQTPLSPQESDETLACVAKWVATKRASKGNYGGIVAFGLEQITTASGAPKIQTYMRIDPAAPAFTTAATFAAKLATRCLNTPPMFLSRYNGMCATGNYNIDSQYTKASLSTATRTYDMVIPRRDSSISPEVDADQRQFVDAVMKLQLEENLKHVTATQVPDEKRPRLTRTQLYDELVDASNTKAQPAIRNYFNEDKHFKFTSMSYVCKPYSFEMPQSQKAQAKKIPTSDECIAKAIADASHDWKQVTDNGVFFGTTLPDGSPADTLLNDGMAECALLLNPKKNNPKKCVYGYNYIPIFTIDGAELSADSIAELLKDPSDWIGFQITDIPFSPPQGAANLRFMCRGLCLFGRAFGKPPFSKRDTDPSIPADSLAF